MTCKSRINYKNVLYCELAIVDDLYRVHQNGDKHMEAGYLRRISFSVSRIHRGKIIITECVSVKVSGPLPCLVV